MGKKSLTLAMTLAILVLSCGILYAADDCTLSILPNLVTIGTGYNGTQIQATGTIPEGTTAVIRVMGEHSDKHFKKKGKVFGLLWMNVGMVELHHVPGLFLIGTDAGTEAMAQGVGFDSVKGETDDLIFGEFLKLKAQDGMYMVEKDVVSYKDADKGQRAFTASISLPSSLHKGVYSVEVLALRDGQIVGRAEHELHAELRGFPAMLSAMAFGHPLAYGISAALIAILAGLGMTLLFREKGGVH